MTKVHMRRIKIFLSTKNVYFK